MVIVVLSRATSFFSLVGKQLLKNNFLSKGKAVNRKEFLDLGEKTGVPQDYCTLQYLITGRLLGFGKLRAKFSYLPFTEVF